MLPVSARSGRPLQFSASIFAGSTNKNPTLPPFPFPPQTRAPILRGVHRAPQLPRAATWERPGGVSRRGSRSKPYSLPSVASLALSFPAAESTVHAREEGEDPARFPLFWHAWKAGTLDLSPVAAGFVAARAPLPPLPWVDCSRGVSAQELGIHGFFRSEF